MSPEPPEPPSVAAAKPPTRWRRWLWENLQIVVIALALVVVIRTFIAEPRYIPSDSMAPTLAVGDRVVVEKVSYYFRPPADGEIVVFEPPPQLQAQGYQASQAFIKRVVGTAGEWLAVQEQTVLVNGEPQQEDYIAEPPAYQLGPVVIPPHYLFVMGDNRNNSNDSHLWGLLPERNVIGRATFRFWPLGRLGWV